MRNISVGRVLVAAGAVFSALCGLAEEEETPTVTPAATANWVGPAGEAGGVVSADANWNPQGMPTRVMRLTGDSAGKTLVFDAAYDEYGGKEGQLIVGGTNATDAAQFGNKTDGWTPVVLTATDDTYGITYKYGICVGDRDGVQGGALRIERGTYTVGESNRALSSGQNGYGYFEMKGGTLYAKGDFDIACLAGGEAVIGSNEEGAIPAVVDVDTSKWTYTAVNDAAGKLTIRKSGTLKTCYISDKSKEPKSVIVLDGGTLCRNGYTADQYGHVFVPVTIRMTANGGTLHMEDKDGKGVYGELRGDIVDDDPDSETKGTLRKTGEGELVFLNTKSYAGATVIEEGSLVVSGYTQLGDIEIKEGAELVLDMNGGDVDGKFSYPLMKTRATLTLTGDAELSSTVKFRNVDRFENLQISEVEGVITVSGQVKASAAVAEIVEPLEYFSTLPGAGAKAAAGQTVRLLKDVSLSGSMEFKGSTLDLNGHTLTRNGTDSVIEFAGSAVVTNGTILADTAYQAGGSALLSLPGDKNAVLTVVDVNVGDEAGHNPFCLFNTRQNATVKIRNGVWHVATLLSSYYASGKLEISGGSFYLRGWHTANENYRKGTVVLSGGLYSLAPRASYAATDYVVQHRPGGALPYAVVSAATEGLVKPDGWSFAYADQATADAAVVVKLGEGQTPYTSLADAVRVAKEGDTVTLVGDTVSLPEQVTIDKNITIEGNGHLVKVPQPYVAESGFVAEEFTLEYAAVFFIAEGADAVIRNVHVMGGGIVNAQSTNDACYGVRNEGTVFLDNVTVTRSNGAVWNNGGAYLYADNCRFVRNCRYCAGGLFNHGTAVLNRTSLSENRSLNTGGGGGAIENGGTLYINNCVFCNNSSTEIGGAINNYAKGRAIALYMMNTTIVGNFTQFNKDVNGGDQGGGIGVRANENPGHFFSVNNLICNNYQLRTENPVLKLSDIRVLDQGFKGGPTSMTNALYYTVYGSLTRQGKTDGDGSVLILGDSNKSGISTGVFKAYEETQRIYQNGIKSPLNITGAQLVSKDDGSLNHELARYAPISKTGGAVLGTAGVYTYFDPSGWKTGVVRMSYAPVVDGDVESGSLTAAGEMVAFGGLPPADTDHMVTNYYESATGRSFGVAGASGWLEEEKVYHTVKLAGEVVNGSVSGITLYGDAYEHGTEITLTATPGFTRTFLGWFENDAGDEPVSTETVWTFQVLEDRILQPRFSDITPVVLNPIPKVHVTMADGQETKPLYPITVTTAWMDKTFDGYAAEVEKLDTVEKKEAYLTGLLEGTDEASGLKKWQAYVLGNPSGKLWINSPQYKSHNGDQLRFEMNKLAPVAGSGFQIRYRLDKRLGAAETFARDKVNATGSFDVDVATDPTGLYVIDLLFVPDGEATSEEYVTTVNTAGVLRVETRAERAALAVPWTKLRPTAASEDVAAVDLVKTTNLTAGDKLYVYDGASKMYKAWQLRESGLWEPVAVYRVADGYVDFNQTGTAPEASAVARGTGVWLQRQRTEGPVYLCGQYETASVTTPLAAGWNLVGSPTTVACDLSQLEPADGDRIVVPTAAEPKNMTWKAGTEGSPGSWGYWENRLIERWGMKIAVPTWVENAVVPAGNAFWYIRPDGGESSTLNW